MAASKFSVEEDQCQLKRISDMKFEPGKLFLPIEGYEKMPIVPLEEAVLPLVNTVPDIRRKAYIAVQRCQEPQDGLTPNESASIFLYTLEWSPDCVYSLLNSTLRSEHRQYLLPWFSYLKLLLTALWKLPSQKLVVHRGVRLDLSKDYVKGKTQVWWGFSSTTQSVEILESELFLGKSGERTLFTIECLNGKLIKNHSYYAFEDEVLLLPATQFQITGKLDLGNNIHTIMLKEVVPHFPLLEPPFVEKVPTIDSQPSSSKITVVSNASFDVAPKIGTATSKKQDDKKIRDLIDADVLK
ncbi:unnamed protein product [Rotaria sp. Silwood2]|nr:unnamed protein product [Rotaria sp. Silwood2]